MRNQKRTSTTTGIVLMIWWSMAAIVVVLAAAVVVEDEIECSTVTSLVAMCSNFIMLGFPEPIPGSACCNAVMSLNNIADSTQNRRSVCRCLMSLVTTYNPNATTIAVLPGLCGISLGYTIHPNTDCNYIS